MPPKRKKMIIQYGGNENWNPYILPPHLSPDVIARQRKAMREYKPKWYDKGIIGEIKGNKILSQLARLVNTRAGNWVEQKGWGKNKKRKKIY